MKPPPRDRRARIADTQARLEQDIDAWVATADPRGGAPALVPLSFDWDGTQLLLTTPAPSPAGRNMRESGLARLALGTLRDVVMIDATVTQRPLAEFPDERWQRYARRTGWDPRAEAGSYAAYLVTPRTIQAWRESNELPGRTIMQHGIWLT